jgi:hypothetical protein
MAPPYPSWPSPDLIRGSVPAIHAFLFSYIVVFAWMPGTSPGMTTGVATTAGPSHSFSTARREAASREPGPSARLAAQRAAHCARPAPNLPLEGTACPGLDPGSEIALRRFPGGGSCPPTCHPRESGDPVNTARFRTPATGIVYWMPAGSGHDTSCLLQRPCAIAAGVSGWGSCLSPPSWPGLSRPSTTSFSYADSVRVDARHKAGHDGLCFAPRAAPPHPAHSGPRAAQRHRVIRDPS